MKGPTPTQCKWLALWLPRLQVEGKDAKMRDAICERLARVPDAQVASPAAAQVQAALISASNGKVAPIEGAAETYWARMQGHIARKRVTLEQAAMVGELLGTHHWRSDPYTIQDVLQKWEGYLATATARAASSAGQGSGRRPSTW